MVDLNRMALQMAKVKRVGELDDLDVARVTITPNWAPMLPRDRAELVNELVQRAGVGHIHPTDAIEQYEDTPTSEVEETYKRIQEHLEWQAELGKSEMDGIPAEPVRADQQSKARKKET